MPGCSSTQARDACVGGSANCVRNCVANNQSSNTSASKHQRMQAYDILRFADLEPRCFVSAWMADREACGVLATKRNRADITILPLWFPGQYLRCSRLDCEYARSGRCAPRVFCPHSPKLAWWCWPRCYVHHVAKKTHSRCELLRQRDQGAR